MEKEKIMKEQEKFGSVRYLKNDGVKLSDFDIDFAFANGNYDKGAMVTDIFNSIKLAPEYREALMPKVLDILGLNVSLPKAEPQQAQQGEIKPAQDSINKMSEALTL